MKVTFKNETYTLLQDTYIDIMPNGDVGYMASAINDGADYMIYWIPKEGWLDIEDQSDVCDWFKPSFIKKI